MKKKERKGEKRKRAEEFYPYLGSGANTTLCTNSGKFWVAPGVTLRRCPLERGCSRAPLETPAGNCQRFLRKKAFHGRVSASWKCPWAGPLPFQSYFGSKIKCLFISLKWALIEGAAALLQEHQTNVVWCFSFPNPKGTCP